MLVTIDQLRTYFTTNHHPSRSDWNDFFDTLAGLKAQIDAGPIVDVSKFIRKDQDDGTPFVLSAKTFRSGGGNIVLRPTMSLRSSATLTSGQYLWFFKSASNLLAAHPVFAGAIPWDHPNLTIETNSASGFNYVWAKIGTHAIPSTANYPVGDIPAGGTGTLVPTSPETRIITSDGVSFNFAPSGGGWGGQLINAQTPVFAFYANSSLTLTLTALNPPPPGGDQVQIVPLEDPSSVYAIGRTGTLFGQNRDLTPLVVNLDEVHGGTKGTFVTNGPGQVTVASLKWLTVSYTILNAGTGNANDNLVALTVGLQD
jgi:hypothetical protein